MLGFLCARPDPDLGLPIPFALAVTITGSNNDLFTSNSNLPSMLLSDMGVYGRTASVPSKSSLPPPSFRPRPSARMRMHAQTGKFSDWPSGSLYVEHDSSYLMNAVQGGWREC